MRGCTSLPFCGSRQVTPFSEADSSRSKPGAWGSLETSGCLQSSEVVVCGELGDQLCPSAEGPPHLLWPQVELGEGRGGAVGALTPHPSSHLAPRCPQGPGPGGEGGGVFSSLGWRTARPDKPRQRPRREQARVSSPGKTNRRKCHRRAGQAPRPAPPRGPPAGPGQGTRRTSTGLSPRKPASSLNQRVGPMT